MKKSFLFMKLLLFAVFLTSQVQAQVSGYTFSQSSGTYTPITTPISVHASGWDDGVATAANGPIGFTFVYNGVSYTSCRIATNGHISFGATATTGGNYTPISATTGYASAISAFGRDLISNASTITRATEGTAPNRVFIVQWNNARRYNGLGAVIGDDLNFQIRLSETTNQIQIVYGTCTATDAIALTCQVGLRGANNSDFNNRASATDWSATTAGGSNTASVTTSNTIMPASGLTYTWSVPPCPLAPSALLSSAVTTSGATISWTAPSPAPGSGYEYYVSTSATPPTALTTPTGSTAAGVVSVALTGLPSATQHFFWVRSNCNGTDKSGWAGSATFTTLCNASTMPYFEGFESATVPALPPCVTGSHPLTRLTTAAGAAPRTGTRYQNIRWTPTVTKLLYSAPLAFTSGISYDMGAWYLTDGIAGWTTIRLHVNTAPSLTGATLLTTVSSAVNTTYQKLSGTHVAAATGTYYSIIEVVHTSAPNDMSIDDMFAMVTPTCFEPTALTNTGVSASAVNHAWTAPTSGTTPAGYEWAFTTSATPPVSGTATAGTTASSTGLATGTYYLHVRSDCGGGDISAWATSAPFVLDYCTPIYSTGKTFGDLISNVTVVGTALDNNTGTAQVNPAYTFFNTLANHTGDLQAGTSYDVQVSVGTWGDQRIRAWIDFNDNLVFEASEQIGTTLIAPGLGNVGPFAPATFTISLPCNPPVGIHRMRIRSVWQGAATIDPCTSYGFGETEDYNVNVLAPPPCPSISSLAVTPGSLANVAATATWSLGCVETAWDVDLSNSATPSMTPSNPNVASNTFNASGLTPNTLYYLHVRANCGLSTPAGTGESSWQTISFTTLPNPPSCVTTSAAPANPLCDNQNLVFTWASDPVATSYLITLGTTSGGTQIFNNVSTPGLTATIFTPLINQTYYWTVTPVGAGGPAVGCTEQTYTTGSLACVCLPVYSNTPTGTSSGDLISAVSITGTALNNNVGFTAGQPHYLDFFNSVVPTQTASMSAGSSYTVNVSTGEWGSQGIRVWIDFNGDNQFDVSESVGSTATTIGTGFTPGSVNASASFNISLPCNPVPGDYRMRVRGVFAVNGPTIDPCNGYTYGQVHDYKVTVLPPPPCPAPSGLAASGVTTTTATLNWVTGCTETAWDVKISTSINPNSGAITNPGVTPTPTLALSSLTPGTSYFAHVRAVCGGGAGNSAWITVPFTTPLPGCINTTAFGSGTIGAGGSSVTLTTCAYAGEYSTINGVTAATPYESTATGGAGNWITIRQGTFNGPLIAEGNSPLSWTSTVAGTYFQHINTNSACGTENTCHTSTVTNMAPPPPPPANDECAGAINFGTISAVASCQLVNLESATETLAACPPADGTNDVWYAFTVPNTGGPTTEVFYSTTNISGSFDRVYEVFDACGGFSIICLDPESGSFNLPAGTYRLRTMNFSSFDPLATSFNLCLYLTPVVPSNDNICNALAIKPSSGTSLNTNNQLGGMPCTNRVTNTQLATASGATEGSCGGSNGSSVWYTFTTPACVVGGVVPFQLEVSTDNALTSYDTKIQVFSSSTGTCLGTLTSVQCNDDGASTAVTNCGGTSGLTSTIVRTDLLPNTTYYVLVDGFAGAGGILEVSGRALIAEPVTTVSSPTQIVVTTPNRGASLYTYFARQVGSTGYATSNSTSLSRSFAMANGQSYHTQVVSRCTSSTSQWYRSARGTIAVPSDAACTPVTDLTCTPGSTSGWDISWTEVPGLFTNGGTLSGYMIYYRVIGASGYSLMNNPTVTCTGGVCSYSFPGLTNPAGYEFWIKTRCSATTQLQSNTTNCNGIKSGASDIFSFVNTATGVEYVDMPLSENWNDFGLEFRDLGDYYVGINKDNEIYAEKIGEANLMNFGDDVSFELVPNPTSSSTSMTFKHAIKAGTFTVVDAMGRNVLSGDISNTNVVELDGSKWNAGVYLVNVTTNDKTTMRRLVISK